MISPALLALVRCPDCRGELLDDTASLVCRGCGRQRVKGPGYLDLRPSTTFAEQTKYLDDALHADHRHETVSPPLLQAGVRQRMLQQFLQPRPGDLIVDLGCGSGRSLVWNRESGADMVGIDVAPYFALQAIEGGDLVLGDLRRLPFADRTFSKGYALDVFEHLSRESLGDVLGEIGRVMRPGGHLFAYSHVRKNSALAGGLRGVNALARGLERIGLVDLQQERLRKSDHLNPLADIPDLERTVHAAGFRIARIRYYTPLVGAFVENVLMRVAERGLGRWTARNTPERDALAAQARLARSAAKARLARHGALYRLLQAVTTLMMTDVWMFGAVRTGPFFVLLERTADVPAAKRTGHDVLEPARS